MQAQVLGPLLPGEVGGLLRFARTLTANSQQAEDLVQDTLIRALERADTFRGDAALATWLHRILHNLAVDRARRTRETPTDEVMEAVEAAWREDDYTVDAAVVVTRAETRAELEDALIHVPVVYRAAVVLHDAEGLTVQEVADIQNVSLAAAKQRLRRGRMMIVSQLARGHERRAALGEVPLRCWDARRNISGYLDGELDDQQVGRLRRHLEGCPTCPPLVASLVGTARALRQHADADRDANTVIPAALAQRLAEQVGSLRLRPASTTERPPAADSASGRRRA